MNTLIITLACIIAACSAKVYYKETFDNGMKGWTVSSWKKSDGTAGKFEIGTGPFAGDAEADKGLRTTQDARFYAISSKIEPEFSNEGKDLVLQFSVKHAQEIDCGGGYIKLFPADMDPENLSGDSKYNIMFGPDICGMSTKRVHVIFNYEDENLLIKKDIPCQTDQLTHVYTLIVRPDNTFEVRIDGENVQDGSLEEHWDFLEPKEIKDPSKSKPSDWVDEAMIDDPNDTKPAGYDDIPEEIADPDAEMPDDWDEEDDGEWDAPMIPNPEFKGPWTPKRIPNPDYKGAWVHPKIPNPDYEYDEQMYLFPSIGHVGFDLWQVKAGTVFDNIIVTDDIKEAEKLMAETFTKNKAAEKAALEKLKNPPADDDEEEDDYDDEDYEDEHDEL